MDRANRTLQDRLVKELRLEGMGSMEAGNAFLPSFMEDHNLLAGLLCHHLQLAELSPDLYYIIDPNGIDLDSDSVDMRMKFKYFLLRPDLSRRENFFRALAPVGGLLGLAAISFAPIKRGDWRSAVLTILAVLVIMAPVWWLQYRATKRRIEKKAQDRTIRHHALET